MTEPMCQTCLLRPAIGVLIVHTAEHQHIADWWTCPRCADHDAEIQTSRGMIVALVVRPDIIDNLC